MKQQILTGDLSISTASIFNPHSGFVAGLSDKSQQKVSVCLCVSLKNSGGSGSRAGEHEAPAVCPGYPAAAPHLLL